MAESATSSSLEGRAAIITGAGKGLGRAYALALAARGAQVIVNNRRHPGEQDSDTSAQQTVAAIRAAGGTAFANFEAADAEGAGGRMVQQAVDHFGRVDIVIANAAMSQASTFGKQSLDDFMRIFNVGFLGTLNLIHAAWPLLRAQRHGRVIATTSSAGRYGNHGLGAYAASKGAIEMLVRSLAAEGASAGVRVNAISPYGATQMTAGHLAPEVAACLTPEAVAPMVAWLSSDACTANGQIFVAGGGRFRRGFSVETDSVAGNDMDEVAQTLADLPGRPHPSSNHAFATLVEELRAGGQIQ
jgi:NAD(P)-dependent dehydrogenase (short-subunit alcohol dehydrogenase family)